MSYNNLKRIIDECVKRVITEAWYTDSATPIMTHTGANSELGSNPLRTDVGNHSANDEVRQPSTFDRNGANFKGEHIVFSDNKFNIYKIKNFGSLDVTDTLSFFGKGANGEKELRRAIDILNGAADRNGKFLSYRTITSESHKNISQRTSYMKNTFWEYSFNNNDWYILLPNPIEKMKLSKLVQK
jgi:hypothetical protein